MNDEWEYKVIVVPFYGNALGEILNEHGTQGWRLAQIMAGPGGDHRAVFERRKSF